jgi:hypothetical protein
MWGGPRAANAGLKGPRHSGLFRFDYSAISGFALRHLVAATAVIALVAYAAVFSRPGDAPIHSDGYSYYVYLPSWVIYRDVTFDALAREWYGGAYPEFTALRRWPSTGHWLNPHPIGTALLMAPFFAAGDALSRWSNLPRDGFSVYYQHAAGLAAVAYLAAGLAVLRRILTRHFSGGIALATLIGITWGTNLFHYGVFDGTFSHVFSFFLVCLWLLLVEEWWPRPTWGRSLALGGVAALIVLVRHTNAMFLLVLPLYGVTGWPSLRARLAELWQRRGWLGAAAIAGLIALIPQIVLYRFVTGLWFVSPYSALDGGFTFGSPHLAGVLVSTEKGLFFWSPLLLLAAAGAIVAKGWARGLVVVSVVLFAAQTYLTASWWDWQYGASYGHRAFTDGLGLAAVMLAAFFEWAAVRPGLRRAVAALVVCAVLLSVVQMLQYWTGNIPNANTSWDQYRASFLRFR